MFVLLVDGDVGDGEELFIVLVVRFYSLYRIYSYLIFQGLS